MSKRRAADGWTRRFLPWLLLAAILLLCLCGAVFSWRGAVARTRSALRGDVAAQAVNFRDELNRQYAVLDGYSASFTAENIATREELLAKLTRCVENTEFRQVCFAYPDGTLFRNDGARASVSHRRYFRQGLLGQRTVELLVNYNIDPLPRFGVAIPVEIDGQVAGVLLGLFSRGDFRVLFERSFSEQSGLFYLCDSSGKLLLGTTDSEAYLDTLGLSFEEGLTVEDPLAQADHLQGSTEETLAFLKSGTGGYSVYELRGERRYTTYEPLGVNDWFVVSVLPDSMIYRAVTGEMGLLMAILLTALVSVVVLFVALSVRDRRLAQAGAQRAAELQWQFEHDDLTGILSRAGFLLRMEERLPQLTAGAWCLVYFDIDKFKLINERFGYAKGNELLRLTAQDLQAIAEAEQGLCARNAADGFVLLIPHRQDLLDLFSVKQYREQRVVPMELYLHYGVYVIRDLSVPADRMIDCARMAQKTVKGSYLDYLAYYDDRIREQLLREQEIVSSMSGALERGEFVPYLQPQIDYATGRISGAEVLVRWLSPERGLIPPGEFIPVFERNGFITLLDENIWRQTCRLLRRWLDEGREVVPLSVNVSRTDLLRGNVAERLCRLLDDFSLPTRLLRVEVTESAYMDNPRLLIRELQALTDAGFVVEMDDFGSGYSSLNALKDLPVQVLKTDLKFLGETGVASRRERILSAIVALAHEMGMAVVAEGVETREQAAQLLALGCRQMQGYYFSRPVPTEEFERMLFGEEGGFVKA